MILVLCPLSNETIQRVEIFNLNELGAVQRNANAMLSSSINVFPSLDVEYNTPVPLASHKSACGVSAVGKVFSTFPLLTLMITMLSSEIAAILDPSGEI